MFTELRNHLSSPQVSGLCLSMPVPSPSSQPHTLSTYCSHSSGVSTPEQRTKADKLSRGLAEVARSAC